MNQRVIPNFVAWLSVPVGLASRIAVRSRGSQARNGVQDQGTRNRNGVRNPAIRPRETPTGVRDPGMETLTGVRDRGMETPTGVRDPSKSGWRPQPRFGSGACVRAPSPPSGAGEPGRRSVLPSDGGDERRSGLPVRCRVGRTEACVGSGRVGNPDVVRASRDPEPEGRSVPRARGADPEPKGRSVPQPAPDGSRIEPAFGHRGVAGCVVGFSWVFQASVHDG